MVKEEKKKETTSSHILLYMSVWIGFWVGLSLGLGLVQEFGSYIINVNLKIQGDKNVER
jgi:uncharacterized membrane protein YoaK (UPF0700 family)